MTHVHADVALYEAMQAALLVGFVFMAMLPSEAMVPPVALAPPAAWAPPVPPIPLDE